MLRKLSLPALLLPNLLHAASVNNVQLYGLTATQHRLIFQLTSLFENSTPELDYGYIENINDGRGYTFGYVGFCTGTGDGYPFIRDYIVPVLPNAGFQRFLPRLQQLAETNSSATDGLEGFTQLIQSMGKNETFRAAMDKAVDDMYFRPAMTTASQLGLNFALSRGEMYDAYINHGKSGADDIINKTNQILNASASNLVEEKVWLQTFLDERNKVLAGDRTWQSSTDRVKVYKQLLSNGNVQLQLPQSFSVYGTNFAIVNATNGLQITKA